MKEKALQYLNRDSILNMDMIETIRHNWGKLLYVGNQGVLLFNESSEAYMMSIEDEKMGFSLLKELDLKKYGIVLHQPIYEQWLNAHYSFKERMVIYQMVYLHQEKQNVEGDIRKLDKTYLAFVDEHYGHGGDQAYISQIIESGWLYGIFVENQLAGFIGRHLEGSIGLLQVLPEYKRQHLGTKLMCFMINKYIEKGYTPFSQVVEGNEASFQLHLSLGFTLSKSTIIWKL